MSLSRVSTRHARMLKIFRQLQSGRGLNAGELAEQLAVCRRTVFRDLSTLREAGIELYFDESSSSYRLGLRNDVAPIPTLDQGELTTLVAAIHFSVLRQLPDCREPLRQAVNKLLAVTPSQMRHQAARVSQSCRVEVSGRPFPIPQSPVVNALLTAISLRRVVRATLLDAGQSPIETHFAPYQLLADAQAWQVVGRSSYHVAVRAFDPDQMTSLELTEQIYAIPRRYQTHDMPVAG